MIHTTFQNELNKIFGNDSVFDNTRFVGRACYGSLGADLKASAQFVSLHISSQYDALKINIINRTEGAVDSVTIRFKELWGNKFTNNPNFREGVSPHLWLDGDKLEWYVYTPTNTDFEELREAVSEYTELFREQTMEQQQGGGMQMT
ncbi:MAG: hypothetical protein BWY15_01750 [Firmicutes bacterium ADurb.Bin193]|nr:MAG: hypothetical protein BWY15_01750 [Firmicutes bacterium ADurb.Bin193]